MFGTSRNPENVKIWPGGNILSASEYALPAKVQSTHLPSQVPQPTSRRLLLNSGGEPVQHLPLRSLSFANAHLKNIICLINMVTR